MDETIYTLPDLPYDPGALEPHIVEAIWNVVDWVDVERRFQAARGADLAIA